MDRGSILRQRKIRTYGESDCRNYFEFLPDSETRKDFQTVFVSLLLGKEHLKLTDKPGGKVVMEPLDITTALNELGWWSQEQLEAGCGVKKTEALIKKMADKHKAKRAKKAKEGKDGGQTK